MASKSTSKEKKQASVIGFAPIPDDLKLIGELRSKLEPTMGRISNSTLFRMGLRKLAEAEGLR